MPSHDDDQLRQTLRDILVAAGEVAMGHFGSAQRYAKADGSDQTTADVAVEELLVDALARAFPDDAIVGEEGGRVAGGGGGTWYVDPIDGTSAFVDGLSYWGPTVCRVRDGELDVGAFWVPRLGELWFARRGGGAWRDGTRLRPAEPARLASFHALYAPSRFHRVQEVPWPGKIRALGSSAAHLAIVAGGGGVLTVVPKWRLWDVGCGALLITEAGRMICDATGKRIDVASCREGLPFLAGVPTAVSLLVQDGWLERQLGRRRTGASHVE